MRLLVPVLALFLQGADSSQQECPTKILYIVHINVGQGDATLVLFPSGNRLLIDGGDTGRGAKDVVPALRDLGIKYLSHTLATHYDQEHIGGLDEVVLALEGGLEGKAFDRGPGPKNEAIDQYEEAVGRTNREQIKPGTRIEAGCGVEAICVAANQQVIGNRQVTDRLDDENGSSVALLIRYGTFDYFIGGDLTGGGRSGSRQTPDVESAVALAVGDIDVLRVSHHGSSTSSNQAFLSILKPEVAIISVGNGGNNLRYRYPRREVLDRLLGLESLAAVFLTNRGETDGGLTKEDLEKVRIADGHVVVTTNGHSYTVNGLVRRTDKVNSHLRADDGESGNGR